VIDLAAQEAGWPRRFTAARIREAEPARRITAQGTSARFQLNKVYAALNEARAQQQRLIILGFVGGASAFLLVALFLAWRNSSKGQGTYARSRGSLLWPLAAAAITFAVQPDLACLRPVATETERQTAVDQAAGVTNAARIARPDAGSIGTQWDPSTRRPAPPSALRSGQPGQGG
jgi:hypothetical protein